MKVHAKARLKRIVIEGLGWILVLVGLAALVLPGPGLLALFAGMALLATQYEWAERRLAPVRKQALKTASDGVSTWGRFVVSVLGVGALVAVGVLWTLQPEAPQWWFTDERWWLLGGPGTGVTLILSALIAGALLGWSLHEYGRPGHHGKAGKREERRTTAEVSGS